VLEIACYLGTALCAGLATNLIQVGVLVNVKAALPSLDKVNPAQWFKKTFPLKNLADRVKIVAKTLIMGIVVAIAIKDNLGLLLSITFFSAASISRA
jgi:flagellar biosynthesis protein FlhB